MSGWPSGLRRCVQVAVYSCRRGFESHFWHYFILCKCSTFLFLFFPFFYLSLSVLLFKTMAERRRKRCLTHPVCYVLMNIKWLVSLFFPGFYVLSIFCQRAQGLFSRFDWPKKIRTTFLANHRQLNKQSWGARSCFPALKEAAQISWLWLAKKLLKI